MFRISLTCAFLLLHLASCSSIHTDYPEKWGPLDDSKWEGKCPRIAGLYRERGERSGKCPIGMEACSSLSYDLLVGNIGYREIWNRDGSPNFTTGDFLELRQPADNRLEIIKLKSGIGGEQILSEHVLRMEEGDFTCDKQSLILKKRLMYFLWGLSNMVGTIGMSFRSGNDGSLIMKSSTNYMGHHVFIPGAHAFDGWVRWAPATKEQMKAGVFSSGLNGEVRKEIYGNQSEKELLYSLKQGMDAQNGEAEEQLQFYYSTITHDLTAAHRSLCLSADQGHPDARYRLALLYEYGIEGFKKDYVRAYLWYALAGQSGSYWGGQNALRLKAEILSPESTAAAEEAVKDWQPGQCESRLNFSESR